MGRLYHLKLQSPVPPVTNAGRKRNQKHKTSFPKATKMVQRLYVPCPMPSVPRPPCALQHPPLPPSCSSSKVLQSVKFYPLHFLFFTPTPLSLPSVLLTLYIHPTSPSYQTLPSSSPTPTPPPTQLGCTKGNDGDFGHVPAVDRGMPPT